MEINRRPNFIKDTPSSSPPAEGRSEPRSGEGSSPLEQIHESPFQTEFLALIRDTSRAGLNLTQYAESLLCREENYPNIQESDRQRIIELANNPNNIDVLGARLEELAGCIMEPNTQITSDLLESAENIKQNFFSNIEKALQREESHRNDSLAEFFSEELTGPILEKIEVIKGSDPHNGGRQSCFLRYHAQQKSNSWIPCRNALMISEVTIVYKPRNMEVEKSVINEEGSAFALLNELCGKKILPTYRIVAHKDGDEDYGFEEFISPSFPLYKGEDPSGQETHDRMLQAQGLDGAEVHEFFKGIGALQFAAQLLGITDLHASNLIVHGSHEEGYKMYPIDLETSYDIRVLKNTYLTGLSLGVGLSGTGENFIVTKDGISPRGRRGLDDHPEDKAAIIEGFKDISTQLNTVEAESQLRDLVNNARFQHRFVPIPTKDLKDAINNKDEMLGEREFLDLLIDRFGDDIAKNQGASRIEENSESILAAFRMDRSARDIPFFKIDNTTGIVTYDGVAIGSLPSAIEQLISNIENLGEMKIAWQLSSTEDKPED